MNNLDKKIIEEKVGQILIKFVDFFMQPDSGYDLAEAKKEILKVIKQVRTDRDKESHCNCVEHYVGKRNKGYWIKARDGKEKRG